MGYAHDGGQLGPRPRIPVPPVLQSFTTSWVVALHRLLDPAGGVQGDPQDTGTAPDSDLLSGEPLLGVVDCQEAGPLDWVLGFLHPLPWLVQGQMVGYSHERRVQQERVSNPLSL